MLDAAPFPKSFTARTANVYTVPLVTPVAVWVVVAAPLPLIVLNVAPPLLLTS